MPLRGGINVGVPTMWLYRVATGRGPLPLPLDRTTSLVMSIVFTILHMYVP